MFNRISQIKNNIKIRKRLTALIIVIGLLIVSYGAVMIQNVAQADKKIREINEVYLKNLVNISGLVENLYSVLLENHILNESSLDPNSVSASINMDLINATIGSYSQSITDETQRVLFHNFSLEFYNYIAVLKDIKVLKLSGQLKLADQARLTQEIKAFRKMQAYIKNLIDYNTKAIKENNAIIRKIEKDSLIKTYIFSAILFLISVISVLLLIKDISPSIENLTENLIILCKGEIPKTKVSESNNEIGQMAKLINKLTGNLSQLNQFALTLSKGNYTGKYELSGSDDFIGKALVDLRDNLKLAQEQDEVRKIEEERRNWTNKGHAIFSEILRQRAGGISDLTDNIIKNLVHYLDSNQGGLFLIDDSQKEYKIELISAFAYDRKKFFDKEINFGDGLIGTVALERNTIYLKEIPDDYIEIESGLGDANPNSLLIVPLKFEEEILGVVEIASFKDFKDFEITFCEELAQSIASTLLAAKINAKTEHLLEESEKKSEELAAQEIEMRQNMEEMRATQELAQRREADLSGILSAVDNTLMKGEYDVDGTLLSVNNRHLQTMGYQLSEIKGKNIEMFIPNDELEEFRRIWKNVVEGNPRQIEVERKTKSGDLIWLINQYTPVQDEKGTISKVLYLAHDVTKYKKSEKDTEMQDVIKDLLLQKENLALSMKEYKDVSDNLNKIYPRIEIDQNFKLIYFNDLFNQFAGFNNNELKSKNFLQLVSDESKTEIKSAIDKAFTNKSEVINSEIKNKSGEIKAVQLTLIPISDNEEKVLKLQIFVLDLSGFSSDTNALEDQQELIELKKKELADIKKEIIETQKTRQIVAENKLLDKEDDKLYNKWLDNIKKQLE